MEDIREDNPNESGRVTVDENGSFSIFIQVKHPTDDEALAEIERLQEKFSKARGTKMPPEDVLILRFLVDDPVRDVTLFNPSTHEVLARFPDSPNNPVHLTHSLEIPCTLWADKTTIYVVIGGPAGYFTIPSSINVAPDRDEQSHQQLIDNLITRNKQKGYFYPEGLSPYLDEIMNPPAKLGLKAWGEDIFTKGEDDHHTILRKRTGPRLNIKPPKEFRISTSRPIQQTLGVLGRGLFQAVPGDDAILSATDEVQVRINCDSSIGFTAERAMQTLANCGPSAVQTYLALAGVWLEQCKGQSYETYLTVSVTDILRFMGRKPTSHGGYDSEEILPRGADVYLLSRTSIHEAFLKERQNKGRTKTRVIAIENLIMIQKLIVQDQLGLDGERVCPSYIEFRYHLGETMYNFLSGDSPQYAEISTKLLRYHPRNDKYLILLGFALACHERVNRNQGKKLTTIGLVRLLNMASIPIPDKNLDRFLKSLERAIDLLNVDGIIDGARLDIPGNPSSSSARQRLNQASVTFPVRSLLLHSEVTP